jgi:hypothetical protein
MAKRKDPPPSTPSTPITPDDLQRGFAGIQQGFKQQVDDRKSTIVSVAGGIGLVVVIVIFLLGRRSGKKTTTFVEIRRV